MEGEEITIPLRDDGNDDDVEVAQPSGETTQRVLVAKDSGLVSDEVYHELRMSLPEDERAALPPISVLKQERNRQNTNLALHPIPGVCVKFVNLVYNSCSG